MGWDRHKLLWDGAYKYVPWTTPETSWQTKAAKSFDICGCKIQNLKVDSVLTAYPADHRRSQGGQRGHAPIVDTLIF